MEIKPKIGVVQFPGSNCERETILAIQRAGMEPVEILWNQAKEKLTMCDGYVLVGGFSYEDRSRAGIIAALDPLMDLLKIESQKGKPILGICNGAQILVESGMVPGTEKDQVVMALVENKRMQGETLIGTGYYNAWVHIRLSDHFQRNAFTRHLNSKRTLRVPVAHAQGRFVMSETLFNEIDIQGLNLFLYCNEKGDVISSFPTNPNGSIKNIAGIANKAGNVLALMPHPERTEEGDVIFQSMRDYILAKEFTPVAALHYDLRLPHKLSVYHSNDHQLNLTVQLTITDNEAKTVQNTLLHLGISVKVQRFTHWVLEGENVSETELISRIKKTEVLFNPRKEKEITISFDSKNSFALLILGKENLQGPHALQVLKKYFGMTNLTRIQQASIWLFTLLGDEKNQMNIEDVKHAILNSHIIHNPYAHDCYQFNAQ